ncbi:MerR family transcriptional regulator [Pseudomonas sp. GOM7]|uniref:MerR family transcriptional regulator n=1 Tax=unclassified Pseudomonas TaxID=196821 RepID=UPI00227A351E|nr:MULTISPECIES: MerR family transcriptional regulator [unclassified Pseudomonas]WAJ38666.1 MerR family transcriptional regulator [Pseudomonas sp. GOM7]
MNTDTLVDHETGNDYRQALDEGYLPIREVARSTGVNAVTLRAWERRYGLIVPYRTPKGHRLYSPANVTRIQAILAWLARGVAVGQVKSLLDHEQVPQPTNTDNWSRLRNELLTCIVQFNERRLDERFNASLALYPAATLAAQLLWPLLGDLRLRWQGQFGNRAEQVFFFSWLRSKLATRVYHSNRQANGAPLLLVNIGDAPMEPGLWLSAWLISASDCPVEVFDWPVPPNELLGVLEQMVPRALLLYAEQALDGSLVHRQLPRLAEQSPVPLLIAGPATHIHRDALVALNSASDPLAAHAWLCSSGLLGPQEVPSCAD